MAGTNKVAIITGAASGVGWATTEYFSTKGFCVFAVDLAPLKSQFTTRDPTALHFYQKDLAEDGACDEVVEACVQKFGRVDVLANVAGILDFYSSADTLDDAVWEKVMKVNVTVPVRLMRAALKHFKQQKSGAIVNVSSKAGTCGGVSGISYSASKHALIGATQNVAWRFRHEGIRCNAVLPGAIETTMTATMDPSKYDFPAYTEGSRAIAAHLMDETGKVAAPAIKAIEVAKTIFFLASDDAARVNGACLPVDNAWCAI